MTIEVDGVRKEFPAPGGGRTLAIADTSFSVDDGEFVVIVGPSGCGKTTVLNMIAGLAAPSAGTIRVDGATVDGPGVDRGVMFQDYALFPWQTVEGNVGFALRHGPAGADLDEAARARRVAETIALLRRAEAGQLMG